jgi:hypothetical protein
MTILWRRVSSGRLSRVCEDRPALERLSQGGVRLELVERTGSWVVELTQADAEGIAEEIGYRRPGYFRPEADSDS